MRRAAQEEGSPQPPEGVISDQTISIRTGQNVSPNSGTVPINTLVYANEGVKGTPTYDMFSSEISAFQPTIIVPRSYRRKVPASCRNSLFSSSTEANCFFRADIQPLGSTDQKRQFFSLQKKQVESELNKLTREKQDLLHKSLQLFFRVHFMADKRKKRVEASSAAK